MSDYLWLLLAGLQSSILYGLLGLIVGIVLIVLLKKKNFLERSNSFLNLFVKLYYVIFPIAFFLLFWFTGSLLHTKKQVTIAADEALEQAKTEVYPQFVVHINKLLAQYTGKDNFPSNDEIVNYFLIEHKQYTGAKAYNYVLKLVLKTTLKFTLGEGEERETNIRSMSDGVTTSIFEKKFDVIKSVVHKQINRFSAPFFIPVIFAFLSMMFVPVIEILISVWYRRQNG